MAIIQNTVFGRIAFMGYIKKKNQSKGASIGNLPRSAGLTLVAGLITDMASSITIIEIVIILGGVITGREHLIMWIPIKISVAIGKAMCKMWRIKNSIWLRVSLLKKAMDGGFIKSGISFNISIVFSATSCPLSSHTSQYPVIPNIRTTKKRTIPETHASHL
jgi:hypothetical protein